MAVKKATTKAFIQGTGVVIDPNGDVTLPVDSALPHRFEVVDGIIVDKYDGKTDNEVRIADHAEAQARIDEAQATWDAATEEERAALGSRPVDLPALDLPA